MTVELEHVSGLRELSAALQELPRRIARNVLRGAVAAAAAVIRDEARLRAPVSTGPVATGAPLPGTLKRAIYQKWIRERSNDTQQTFFVGVRQGKRYRHLGKHGDRSQDAYYWRFIEFGTVKMAAHPFLRPAFETKRHEAVTALTTYLEARIPDEAARLPGARP
jgi:HK97 gp10 family phage protein